MRKVKDGPGDFELYGFMTTAPNALIKPVHEKAMQVIHAVSNAVVGRAAALWQLLGNLQRNLNDRNEAHC